MRFCFVVLISLFLVRGFATASVLDDQKLEAFIQQFFVEMEALDPFYLPNFTDASRFEYGALGSPDLKKLLLDQNQIVARTKLNLSKFNPDALSPEALIDLRHFQEDLDLLVFKNATPATKYFVLTTGGRPLAFLNLVNSSLSRFPLNSPTHYEHFLSRLNQFKNYADGLLKLEREGISKGYVDICANIDNHIKQLAPALEADISRNPFYKPIAYLPANWDEATKNQYRARFRSAIQNSIIPAYKLISDFLINDYKPICLSTDQFRVTPQAKEVYRLRLAQILRKPISPQWIYDLGLSELKRTRDRFLKIKQEMKISGSLNNFFREIQADPKSYFTSGSQALAHHLHVGALIKSRATNLFNINLPFDFTILPTLNPEAGAHYLPPTSNNPIGSVYLPVANLKMLPSYEATTLMLHEGIPGHHYQMSLNISLTPKKSRYRNLRVSAIPSAVMPFVEGWALYSESLGYEMDLFGDPFQHFGHITSVALRAARLVLDTGINYFDWSQKQAFNFLEQNLPYEYPLLYDEVRSSLQSPGYLVTYKIGELKIRELRTKAEKELGPRFDVKEFHSQVLESGSISIWALEEKINRWIQSKK